MHYIGVPEGEDREKETENIFEHIIAENFSNLVKETDIQVQEAQRVPNKMMAVQWLGLHASTAGGMGSIPGWETKIPHAKQGSQKKKE